MFPLSIVHYDPLVRLHTNVWEYPQYLEQYGCLTNFLFNRPFLFYLWCLAGVGQRSISTWQQLATNYHGTSTQPRSVHVAVAAIFSSVKLVNKSHSKQAKEKFVCNVFCYNKAAYYWACCS